MKDRFLLYLPPRQLLLSWRSIPAWIFYVLGLSLILLSVLFSGYIDPQIIARKTWKDAFELHSFLISFLLCCTAPLIAPTLLRHRLFLLMLGLLGFVLWVVFCYLLYATFFGSLNIPIRADIKYHFL